MQPPRRFADATFATYRPETASQAEALREAQALVADMRTERGWLERMRRRLGLVDATAWRGLYLVGPVGTGKTHLLVAMYHALHPAVPCAFMHSATFFREAEHPEALAERIAASYEVFCLDEVELDDPANEARLVLLFNALAARGVRIVATSNVEPEKFLSAEFGTDRFQRFLNEEFRARYHVVFVGGEDYRRRLDKPGMGWIGPNTVTAPRLRTAFEEAAGEVLWLPFLALLQRTIDEAHDRLLADLTGYDRLFLSDITIDGTDTALRLLRVIDDLYLRPDPPVLYFTARTPPETWFTAADAHSTLGKGIAEKFERTTSRLYALCEVHDLRPETTDATRG